MPRETVANLTNAQKARNYAKEHKLSFEATYHLMIAANIADGRVSTGIDPNAPTVSMLTAKDAAALNAAKSALSL